MSNFVKCSVEKYKDFDQKEQENAIINLDNVLYCRKWEDVQHYLRLEFVFNTNEKITWRYLHNQEQQRETDYNNILIH